ncbi:MAG: glycosyltransferase family 4 protein [Bacteroidota bacterium]
MNPSPIAKSTASVIVSNEGIPGDGMGSWTQKIAYLLGSYAGNEIDYLLSGPTNTPFQSATTTRIICNFSKAEITRKWFYPIKYRSYVNALKSIIVKHDFVAIVVMDNTKLKNIVSDTIAQHGWQHKCRVLFLQAGFSYEFTREEYRDFRQGLQEIVLLTQKSYLYERNKYHEYPFLVHVLHNPIHQELFYPLSNEQRHAKRLELGVESTERMFLWVSHDRPKKGLDIIIRMWPDVVAKHPASKLIIVGAKREIALPGLRFEGKIPNVEIAKYYQSADVFLFSSLCQEGFGLSLAEAMSCGCFCIASDVGGVDEFFNKNFGLLIQSPNQPAAWIAAIDQYYNDTGQHFALTDIRLLTYDEWCSRFQKIINDSIQFLMQSSNR